MVIKRSIIALLLSCAALLPFGAAQDVQTMSADQLINQGASIYLEGDCTLAQYLFEEALRREPNHTVALYGKGRTLLCQGATEASIESFQQLTQLEPNNVDAYLQIAMAYRDLYERDPTAHADKLDRAYATVQQVERLAPSNPSVINTKGVIFYQQGNYEAAKATLEQAANVATSAGMSSIDAAQIHLNLGRAYRALGQEELALSSFRRAVVMNPASARAHSLLGYSLFLQDPSANCDDAIFELKQGVSLNPMSLETLSNLAIASFECSDYAQAERYFNEALAIDGISLPGLYTYLSRLYRQQGRYDAAVEAAQKGALLSDSAPGGSDPEAYYWMGQAKQSRGDTQGAKQAYERALALNPNYVAPQQALNTIP